MLVPNTSLKKSDIRLGPYQSKSCKELILSFLSQKWPLSTNEIYQLLRKTSGITYQAAHKAVNELVDGKVLIKSEKKYQLNSHYVKTQHKHWEAVETKYATGQSGNVGVFWGDKVITPTAIYSFGEKELVADSIPSAFISKSSMQDIIHLLSKKALDKLAKKIAIKDYEHIQKHMVGASELKKDPLLALDKLNQLANDFYWGKVTYKKVGAKIEICIQSDLYISDKGILFYQKIYDYFMEILGYKKTGRDILQKSAIYSLKKAKA